MTTPGLPLLNVFEVEADGARRHLVCFLDTVLAGVRGIDVRSVVGEFVPGPEGGFDPGTFRVNPDFVEAFTRYMNEEAARSPEVVDQARSHPGEWLYIVDPRHRGPSDSDPPAADVVGCFAVDGSGQVAPGSFQYNTNHAWIDPARGVSGLLSDRRFYDWLHPSPPGRRHVEEGPTGSMA